jgi:hypothetical protein
MPLRQMLRVDPGERDRRAPSRCPEDDGKDTVRYALADLPMGRSDRHHRSGHASVTRLTLSLTVPVYWPTESRRPPHRENEPKKMATT